MLTSPDWNKKSRLHSDTFPFMRFGRIRNSIVRLYYANQVWYDIVDNNRRTKRYTCLRHMLSGDGDNNEQTSNVQSVLP